MPAGILHWSDLSWRFRFVSEAEAHLACAGETARRARKRPIDGWQKQNDSPQFTDKSGDGSAPLGTFVSARMAQGLERPQVAGPLVLVRFFGLLPSSRILRVSDRNQKAGEFCANGGPKDSRC